MGVHGVITPPKGPGVTGGGLQSPEGRWRYPTAFRAAQTTRTPRNSLRKDKFTRKARRKLATFHLEKRRQLGGGELLRYLINCRGDNKFSYRIVTQNCIIHVKYSERHLAHSKCSLNISYFD